MLLPASMPALPTVIARVAVIAAGLGLWFWTQRLLSRRTGCWHDERAGAIGDGVHRLTARLHGHLLQRPGRADALLISSSLVIDALGCWLIASAIFGPTIEPFLGLILLFAARQLCQTLCPLPPPPDMIWRKPGFPALLVTYETSNDLFFSGHTAIAVYGAATLAGAMGPWGVAMGMLIVAFEAGTVLALRAHYTMDVFAGAAAALYLHRVAVEWAPTIDGWISRLIVLCGL
jgi:hypothetical protein